MEHVSRLEFQIHRLGYRFTNVDLLTEALTHSVDDKRKVLDFPLKDKSYSRLTAIGNSVLKFLASHYAIQTCGFDASEGTLTNRKEELVHVENVQRKIGKKLILKDPNGKENAGNIHNCVRILAKFWNNKDFRAPYDQFLKAVLGGVFIDAGGTSGKGVERSMEVFIKLWKDNGMLGSSEVEIKDLKFCFPFSESISVFWFQKDINKQYVNRLGTLLGFEFSNPTLLCEALIQKSLYDQVRNNQIGDLLRQPDYQRLEFLGDSVLEVVIMEFMIYKHPGFQPQNLVNKTKPYVADDYLRELALKLKLNEFLKAKPKFIQETGWNEYNDLMESVIGAMFVDGGITKTKDFILRVCDLHPTNSSRDKNPTLEELEYKLGYKFKDLKTLEVALIHPSTTNSKGVITNLHYNVEWGRLLVEFYAGDYVLRTCKINAKLNALEAHHHYLCGEAVVRNIAVYLQLHKLAKLSPNLKEGSTPFRRYEQFVFSIFGSICRNITSSLERLQVMGKIFYRLWNPYLKHSPKSTLKECFSESSQEQYELRTKLGYLIPDKDFIMIEKKIGDYKFHRRNLLEQALTERSSRFYATSENVGDSERFEFLGDIISSLNVPELVLTDRETRLPGTDICGVKPFVDYDVTNKTELSEKYICGVKSFVDYAVTIDTELLKKYYVLPPGAESPFKELELFMAKCVIGAIFIDTPGAWFEKFRSVNNSYLCISRLEEKRMKMKMGKLKKENAIVKPICVAGQDDKMTRKNNDLENTPWVLESLRADVIKTKVSLPTSSSQRKIPEAKNNAQCVGIQNEKRTERLTCKPKSAFEEFPVKPTYKILSPTPRQFNNTAATVSKTHVERYQETVPQRPDPSWYTTGEDYIFAVSMYEAKKFRAAQSSKRGNVTEFKSNSGKDFMRSLTVKDDVQSSRRPPQLSTSKAFSDSVRNSNIQPEKKSYENANENVYVPNNYYRDEFLSSVPSMPAGNPPELRSRINTVPRNNAQPPWLPVKESYSIQHSTTSVRTRSWDIPTTMKAHIEVTKERDNPCSSNPFSSSSTLEYASSSSSKTILSSSTHQTNNFIPKSSTPSFSAVPKSYSVRENFSKPCNVSSTYRFSSPNPPRPDTFSTSCNQPSQLKLKTSYYEHAFRNYEHESAPPKRLKKTVDQSNPNISSTNNSDDSNSNKSETSNNEPTLFEQIVSVIFLCGILTFIYNQYMT